MRYLNTVYVNDYQARITRSKGSLIVSQPSGKNRVPLEAIDGVILCGGGQITADAIAACAERNIRVACLRRSGAIRFTISGPAGGNVHLRVAQHRASESDHHRRAIARVIVAGKLQNSRNVIGRWARDSTGMQRRRLERQRDAIRERLNRLLSAQTDDHIRGIEGDAARAHFKALSTILEATQFPFTVRQRRPPRDPVNALLGFCYSLAVMEVGGAVEAIGLDPQIGFLHRPRSGRPSLALDLVEELRPLIDQFVVTAIRRNQLNQGAFVAMPGGAVYLSDEGRPELLTLWEAHKRRHFDHRLLGRTVERWALPGVQATLLARHLRGDLAAYPPFVIAG